MLEDPYGQGSLGIEDLPYFLNQPIQPEDDVQTFLPYPNFVVALKHLDDKRLGKQRVEARQIQKAIQTGGGWVNHPATKMWQDNVVALMLYGDCCIREWVRRGYRNSMPLLLEGLDFPLPPHIATIEMPWWLGDKRLHSSHRSKLLEKDPVWYGKFGWTEPPGKEYWWPVREA